MSDLIERYIYQVVRYLPPKERTEIEAELRSLIADQLDDRYEDAPSQADIAKVLAELGDPRKMAASYQHEQYLVGPDLYPYLMMALRYVWLIAPSIVIFVKVFGALVALPQVSWMNLIVDTVLSAVQTTFMFSAVVILFFAIMQRSGAKPQGAFNP
jgi:ABC-type dipeptide/oligopeptide/nickel transport system permease subunit